MPMASSKDLKIVILGTGGVGKSALSMQYVQSVFIEKYDPTIEDSYRKVIEVPDELCEELGETPITLEIMDTAGTDQFTAMRDLYMRNGDAFMFVYSIDSRSSFDSLQPLYEQLLRVKGVSIDKLPILLVGNKCDLEEHREVNHSAVEELSDLWKLPNGASIETSARRNYNVNEAFLKLVEVTFQKRYNLGNSRKSRLLSSSSKGNISEKERGKRQKCILM